MSHSNIRTAKHTAPPIDSLRIFFLTVGRTAQAFSLIQADFDACIIERRNGFELIFYMFGNVEFVNKGGKGGLSHFLVFAGNGFQRFVRVGIIFPSQYGLYGLGHYGPVVFQVVVNSTLV